MRLAAGLDQILQLASHRGSALGFSLAGVAAGFGIEAVLFGALGLGQVFLVDQLQVGDGLIERGQNAIDGLLAKRFQHCLLLRRVTAG
ncbi:hypothetical protein FQZ97_526830 [compost metagenome]